LAARNAKRVRTVRFLTSLEAALDFAAGLGILMGTDEIRAILADARRACEVARTPARKGAVSRPPESLIATLSRLTEAAEALLAERDAFTGRLRRSVQSPAQSSLSQPPDDPSPENRPPIAAQDL